MSDIICVTNRKLCHENFFSRIEAIAQARPAALILREKDLPEDEYRRLAAEVLGICRRYDLPCILHNFWPAAAELGAGAVHLPLPVLMRTEQKELARFAAVGASCHSAKEAVAAQKKGCTYITAGHIFETGCKPGLEGRGLEFLRDVCQSVDIPVYAIGGICAENIKAVRECGAAGACVMSGAMVCDDVRKYLGELR